MVESLQCELDYYSGFEYRGRTYDFGVGQLPRRFNRPGAPLSKNFDARAVLVGCVGDGMAAVALRRAYVELTGNHDCRTDAGIAEAIADAVTAGRAWIFEVDSCFFDVRPDIVDIRLVQKFLGDCKNSDPRVTYEMGGKVPGSANIAGAQAGIHAVPGVDFKTLDCSGFVGEAISRSFVGATLYDFPWGKNVASATDQHTWVQKSGFYSVPNIPEGANVAEGLKKDGLVRIAFLAKKAWPKEPDDAHVALIYNAETLESHFHVGPDTRTWDCKSWQAYCHVYALTGVPQ